MRPGRLNLLNVMNCAQTQQYISTFQKGTQFCDFQHMNEQCIEVQCPGPTCLSNDFVVCWTAKCPISSLLVSFSQLWRSISHGGIIVLSQFHSSQISVPHSSYDLAAHLIHPKHPSNNSSQECFCYFIHFNPIHEIGCGWVRARTYYWFLRCLLLVQHLSNLSRVTLPFIGRHLSQIHAMQAAGRWKKAALSAFIAEFFIKALAQHSYSSFATLMI